MKKLTLIILYLLISGCGNTENNQLSIQQCSNQSSKNQALWRLLNQQYLWQSELDQSLNPDDFNSLTELLQTAIKPIPLDRFSYVQTEQQFDFSTILDGTGISYGFDYVIADDKSALIVTQVYADGSANQLGLIRGDKITHIKDVPLPQAIDDGLLTSEQFGLQRDVGHSISISWVSQNEVVKTGTLEYRDININTVMHQQIIDAQGLKVGYLVFSLFLEKSAEELNQVFEYFQNQDIDQLIVDLRYNGGGCCVTEQLESQIAGHHVLGKKSGSWITHNNETPTFFALSDQLPRLNMDRVIFLTSKQTASSSEAVIVRLQPYTDVTVIGTDTYGKFAGFASWDICGETVNITVQKLVNAAGFTDFENGIPADCHVEESHYRNWGDQTDPLLKEALYFVEHQQCSN